MKNPMDACGAVMSDRVGGACAGQLLSKQRFAPR